MCVYAHVWEKGWSYEGIYSPVYQSVKDARTLSFTSLMMHSSHMKEESKPPVTHTYTHTRALAL